ncbi:50S ribosomal protein L6 [Candidatus Micrarchaeota archaeon]|nr:50S ribosomal protein L6 [Candidatus Micrarchaeota archaeon]
MKSEIIIPEGVNVTIANSNVHVKGPKGEINRTFNIRGLSISTDDNRVVVVESDDKAINGTVKAHIENMIKGVVEPFTKRLIIRYHHFPITVEVKGKEIIIKNYLGERCPRKCKIHGDAKVEVKGNEITITSCDKEAVGQTAHNIKKITRSDRDRRVFQDGIYDVLEG